MAGIALTVPRGASLVRDFVAADYDGDAVSVFLASDALSATLWPGGSTAPIAGGPTASWLDAPSGTWRLSLAAAASAALEPGRYRLRATATRGDAVAALLDGTLEVTPSPVADATASIAPYGSYELMVEEAPWLAHLQARDDQARFLRQRVKARNWLDAIVAANYRAGGLGIYGEHSAAALAWGVPRRPLGPSTIVLDWLAADRLLVTPQVALACTYKAVELVARAQVGVNPQHAGRAGWYSRLAEDELDGMSSVAIDLDGDGRPDLYIPLAATNTLFT
ncbi:MAG: hypothetical protein BGO49_04365 [Planctomycetales bacterium 71-10]|nr:MAG: hypothetical protein BGO49_04365 [Planctomycetales bacterium 71-10]